MGMQGSLYLLDACALKVDFHKTFDSLNWEFVFGVLEALGLPVKYMDWVRSCFTTARFFVAFNGTPVGVLRLNASKSELFTSGIPDEEVDNICRGVGFKSVNSLFDTRGLFSLRLVGAVLFAAGTDFGGKTLKEFGRISELATKDRMIQMGMAIDGACKLYGNASESRDHIFLECSFAVSIWNAILARCRVHIVVQGWEQEPRWTCKYVESKSLLTLILKIAWNAFIYYIWEERNYRIFRGINSDYEGICADIREVVRTKLLT
ncbi:hypothetical protein F3Y22_tig00110325pilonHSYRG00092 [Hibiscus syriacus]|uniref:Reverse transcriptase zinc-binding domain-containing protein n=1 Tax=Hibiscus syriacus TaxID=106335 RepID=A0A6A3AZX3_HIBSY|nr:hypothetical protein F3Y22_tig00110325pilonHSYRG00092 [Hibiscus syriacus]